MHEGPGGIAAAPTAGWRAGGHGDPSYVPLARLDAAAFDKELALLPADERQRALRTREVLQREEQGWDPQAFRNALRTNGTVAAQYARMYRAARSVDAARAALLANASLAAELPQLAEALQCTRRAAIAGASPSVAQPNLAGRWDSPSAAAGRESSGADSMGSLFAGAGSAAGGAVTATQLQEAMQLAMQGVGAPAPTARAGIAGADAMEDDDAEDALGEWGADEGAAFADMLREDPEMRALLARLNGTDADDDLAGTANLSDARRAQFASFVRLLRSDPQTARAVQPPPPSAFAAYPLADAQIRATAPKGFAPRAASRRGRAPGRPGRCADRPRCGRGRDLAAAHGGTGRSQGGRGGWSRSCSGRGGV